MYSQTAYDEIAYLQCGAAKTGIFLNIIFVILVNEDNSTRRRAVILNKLPVIVLMHLCCLHIDVSFAVCENILYSYVTFPSFAAPPCVSEQS